jgi:hypothetical protein
MENLDALLAILHSSNLLLSSQGVQQPYEDPSVDSSSNYRTQRVLFLCLSALCLNALLAEYQESLVILASYELTTKFFLCALLAIAQCPLGRASQNSLEIFLQLCSSHIVFPPEVFSNLKGLPLNC